jgi:hypothetical protein
VNKNNVSIVDKVKALKKGESFDVPEDKDRRNALNAARVLGKRITTRRKLDGGFIVALL